MTYALAKQLKDTGFPQYGQGWVYVWVEGEELPEEVWQAEAQWSGVEKEAHTKIPTLEELIQACGKNLEALVRGRGLKLWSAVGFDDTKPVGKKIIEFETDEPTEAVALLWLALNKKHD